MIKKLLFTLLIAFTMSNLFAQGIIISEVVDGPGSGGYPKYVELTNTTDTDFDLDGYKVRKSGNGSGFSDVYAFSGTLTLAAGESIVVTNMDNTTSGRIWADFNLTAPTNVIADIGAMNGNGDDAYSFTDASDVVIDIYGVELTDGTGEVWEYTDSYAFRNDAVTSSNVAFTASEWTTFPINTLDGITDLSAILTPGTHNATPVSLTDANILTFSFVEEASAAVIDTAAATVAIEVVNGTVLTALIPTITVSTGAAISPLTGEAQDFTNVFNYVVTASDASTKSWNVTVTIAPPSDDAYILSFSFAEEASAAVIDTAAGTVAIEVVNGTVLTALVPTITVSTSATISPLTGIAQDFSAVVNYIVTAENATTKNWNVTVTEAAATSITTIYAIQGQVAVSPYDAMVVTTNGIVTATSTNGYWLQDGAGAWNGIYVYDAINTPAIGDDITIEGEVAEYYELTQMKNLVTFTVNSQGNTVPTAEVITTAACNEEMYEGVLVQVVDATCITADAGYGMWTINNGANASDSAQTDDVMFHFEPTLNEKYNVTGVMYYSFNAYKLLPRDTADVELITAPEANILTFSFAEQANPAVIDPAAGTVVIKVVNGTALTALVPTITVSADATISPLTGIPQDFTNVFSYVVTASDASTKNWNVTVTEAATVSTVTIYEIQGQVDASPYDTMIVITSGIVTALHETKGYWLQDGAGAWNGIYVYDAVNIPAIGDDITIEGEVAEFYGLTQIKNLASYTVNSQGNTLPVAEELTTAACNEEAYESVLVKTLNVEILNADAGYGMWTITNGAEADSVLTDDVMFHFEPNVIYNYNVTGIMSYSFDARKLLPRDENDIETIVGINQSENTVFSVFPNPVVNEINLVNIKNVDYITVSDVTGKLISKISISSENVKISTSDLKAGMYIVSAFYNNGNISTVKFIKK